jgi:trans-feruloyl-CoA hydratase/vanillin synthase
MTTKKYETIKVEKEDGITWVIFNRPDKRNAMSPQLHLDMDDALDDLATDEETQVLVITGAGDAFCAGQDIKLYFRGTETDPKMRLQSMALAEALHVPDADHRDGQRLLLRRRLHASLRLRFRDRGR